MTLQQCIDRLDSEKINVYSNEQKTKWINTVNQLAHNARQIETDYESLEYPTSVDKELLIDSPYDEVYDYYCYAQIDLLNNEIASYNNSVTLYNTALIEFKKAMIRKGYLPKQVQYSNINL